MMFQLVGSLSNKLLDITQRNMARVLSVILSPQHHVAYRDNRTFTIDTTVTPTGAADNFVYIQNTSTVRDLLITSVRIDAGTAETVELNLVTGTPVGGTAVIPLNRSLGNSTAPVGVFESGVDITGLTDGGTLERVAFLANTQGKVDLIERPIILPAGSNQAVALTAVTGAIALTTLIDLVYATYDPASTE